MLLVSLLFSDEGKTVLQPNKYVSYLVVGQNSVFTYQNRKIYNVTHNGDIRDKLDWEQFTILNNYNKFGNYLMHYDKKWYLFDDNKTSIDYDEDSLIAYRSNYDIKYEYIKQNDVIEKKYINKVLKAIKILLIVKNYTLILIMMVKMKHFI
jgi:hypothetical protein